MDKYILIDRVPVPVEDLLKWSEFFENKDARVVKQEKVGAYFVSTVFLAIDHSFGEGPPLLFETMVFSQENTEDYCERCGTWEEAERQHGAAVAHFQKRG